MSALLFRLRAEVRTRWGAWLALALLVGAAGGAVTAVAAGAQRTSSAYDRFLAETNPANAVMYFDCGDGGQDTSCVDTVRSDDAVADATVVHEFSGALVTLPDGAFVDNAHDPCYSGPGDLSVLTDPDGVWGTSINRHRFVSGRAVDPARADEAVISESLAQQNGMQVGDTVLVVAPNPECADEEVLAEFEPETTELRIVGIQRSPYEIVPASGFYVSSLFVSPAFEASDERFGLQHLFAARLEPGHSVDEAVAAFEAAGAEVSVVPFDIMLPLPQEVVDPYATALEATALVALLAVLAVLAPALVRRLRLDAVEQPALWALGMSRRDLRVLALLRALLLAAASSVVTVAVALALSVFFPIGAARPLEPNPGIDADWSLIMLGASAIAALVLVAAIPALFTRVHGRPAVAGRRPILPIPGSRLPVPAWCGVRLALGRSAAAGGGLIAVWVAIVALVGALTFGAGVQHLLATPRLIGSTWDAGLGFPATEAGFPADEVRERVAEHPDVLGYAEATIWSSIVGSGTVGLGPEEIPTAIFGFDSSGVEPALVSGRNPTAADEIALGPKDLDDLNLDEGDEIEVHGFEGKWDTEQVPTVATFRIVGTVVVIAADDKGLGHGAIATLDGVKRLNKFSGADVLWVRLAPGTDREALAVDIYPPELRAEFDDVYFDFDADVVDLSTVGIGRVDAAPVVLAGLLAVLGLGVLLQLVVNTTFRNRRTLAILSALGFGRAQVRSTVRWEAIGFSIVPVVVGLPVGIAIGRVIFREYSARIGAVPEPVTPWVVVVALIPAALAIAVAIAAVPAWRAARRDVGTDLRAE